MGTTGERFTPSLKLLLIPFQLMKLQHERALLTHSFQAIASSLRVKKFELGNALDEVWIAERKIEAAGMSMETAGFSPKRE
jgi:hypothetical protein